MNPRYGDFDTYHMAASAIDEAVRNCVAVGADPARIAILDNFCWGNTDRPETLGSLVRAALACHDVAIALGTPFISGKDSLNNEFRFADAAGETQSIAIPPSLLISAWARSTTSSARVTMDLKEAGNLLYLVGERRTNWAARTSRWFTGWPAATCRKVDSAVAKRDVRGDCTRRSHAGLVRACHDLSEGGLAVAVAEMAFAGGLGANVDARHGAAGNHAAAVGVARAAAGDPAVRRIEQPVPVRSARRERGRRSSDSWPECRAAAWAA